MSGIAGIIRFDGGPVEPGLIEKMTGAMAHRGPDGISHWVRGSVALGQCMLRTTPESLEEKQPLANEDESVVLVMDGRVDNWEELRRELLGRGVRLRDRSDAELVLRAYEEWGEGCLPHIDGDFVWVIWDARKREALLTRDRVGNKPIFYFRDDRRLVFASEPQVVLLTPNIPIAVNEQFLAESLAAECHGPTETLFRHVSRLAPGRLQVLGRQVMREERYWTPDCGREIRYRNQREYGEAFADLITKAVRCRLRAQGDVGCYLSGGIDSSAVAGVVAKIAHADQRPGFALRTYSLIFAEPECDERQYIQWMNESLKGVPVHIQGRTPEAQYYEEETERYLDLCGSPNGAMQDELRVRAKLAGTRVLLTGIGGDEWFGPNPFRIANELRTGKWIDAARSVREEAARLGSWRESFTRALFRGLVPLIPTSVRRTVRQFRNSWLKREPDVEVCHPELMSRIRQRGWRHESEVCDRPHQLGHDLLHWILESGWTTRARDLENRAATEQGIEERHPLHDRRLVEFAFGMPDEQRNRSAGKHVLREGLREILPEVVRCRKDKAEFGSILGKALMLPGVAEGLACTTSHERGWIDRAAVQTKYTSFRLLFAEGDPGYRVHAWTLWAAYSVELFSRTLLKREDLSPLLKGYQA